MGFEQAGFDIAAAVEIDPVHCAAHEFNFPYCETICASVADLDGSAIRQRAKIETEEIAVVFGGAPCQGFSLIGKRALDDPRNGLVRHFVRLVLELAPRFFVFENVKGLTVGKHRAFLDEIVESFERNGYDVLLPYRVLNAAEYGVPQDRRRLFLIGAKRGQSLPQYPNTVQRWETVWNAIRDIPEADNYPELARRDWTEAEFSEPSAYARKLRGLDNAPGNFGYLRRFDRNLLTSSRRTVHTELSRQRFAATGVGDTEPVSRFHKLDPDGVCNTIRAGTASDRGAFTSPRPIHPISPRCITVREAARLHSFPDWFRFHTTKWHGFRQIGNSVPPLLGQAVAAEIVATMKIEPSVPTEVLEMGDSSLLSLTMAGASAHFGVPRDVIPKRTRSKQHEPTYA